MSQGFATVRDTGPRGMITLRGKGETLSAFARVMGVALPDTLGVSQGEGAALAWMSPDELMVICDYDAAPGLAAQLSASVEGQHALVAVVSDARSIFAVEGKLAGDVLAKVSPAEVGAVAPGQIRRTRFAQVAGAFWPTEAGFAAMCFRSQSVYVFGLLTNAAKQGSELKL
ncbi:sarcosine oxidase subunit gamma [Maritimibacter sp. DP1N21-5]|uniref:sarcosine oxidase subunit gamma n=1 Tax=Maritimibacter sp. DP1N21-5 TaxID=2836867 RepID=UPI0021040964|nr:sarcosine oxidase subunit gamma [Maritimibacter sp. DP1N21-5]